MIRSIMLSVLLFGFSTMSIAGLPEFNMRKGVTDTSAQVYDLHMTIFLVCCLIAVVVFGFMFWALLKHRKSKGAKAANFHESTKIEILWTIAPILILVLMAIPATKVLISMEDNSEAQMTILVTGSQWKWHYRYIEDDISFYSLLNTSDDEIDNKVEKQEHYLLEVDKPLVIPIQTKIKFLLTSDDVIHSWWVPDFSLKKDAVPGYINEIWTNVNEAGTYRGQCAELCGVAHGFMPIVVVALEKDDYKIWLNDQLKQKALLIEQEKQSVGETLSIEELMIIGEQVYAERCAACHQIDGKGMPGIFPALAGSKIANVAGDDKAHIDIVLNGKSGTAMQAFKNQLSLVELAGVITYERNAFGNATGDVIQAELIQAVLNPIKQDPQAPVKTSEQSSVQSPVQSNAGEKQ